MGSNKNLSSLIIFILDIVGILFYMLPMGQIIWQHGLNVLQPHYVDLLVLHIF